MPDHKKMIHIKVVCYDYDRILKKHKSNSLSTVEKFVSNEMCRKSNNKETAANCYLYM